MRVAVRPATADGVVDGKRLATRGAAFDLRVAGRAAWRVRGHARGAEHGRRTRTLRADHGFREALVDTPRASRELAQDIRSLA
jgi:hypothetical protein